MFVSVTSCSTQQHEFNSVDGRNVAHGDFIFPQRENEMRVYCLVEAARVCAGLRLITPEDYGNNRLPQTDCWVPSQPTGWAGCGRLSLCCSGRFFTQSHDGRHLDSHCSWTKNSSAVLSPNQQENDESTVRVDCFKSTNDPVGRTKSVLGLEGADIISNNQ